RGARAVLGAHRVDVDRQRAARAAEPAADRHVGADAAHPVQSPVPDDHPVRVDRHVLPGVQRLRRLRDHVLRAAGLRPDQVRLRAGAAAARLRPRAAAGGQPAAGAHHLPRRRHRLPHPAHLRSAPGADGGGPGHHRPPGDQEASRAGVRRRRIASAVIATAVTTVTSGMTGKAAGTMKIVTVPAAAPATRDVRMARSRSRATPRPGASRAEMTPVSVPVRYVVDTASRPPRARIAALCNPIADAASTSSTCRSPPASQPTANRTSTSSSAPSAANMPATCADTHRAIPVPAATPTAYPASASPAPTRLSTLPVPAALPNTTRLPVMTLLNTPPSRMTLAASTAPVPRVSVTATALSGTSSGSPPPIPPPPVRTHSSCRFRDLLIPRQVVNYSLAVSACDPQRCGHEEQSGSHRLP